VSSCLLILYRNAVSKWRIDSLISYLCQQVMDCKSSCISPPFSSCRNSLDTDQSTASVNGASGDAYCSPHFSNGFLRGKQTHVHRVGLYQLDIGECSLSASTLGVQQFLDVTCDVFVIVDPSIPSPDTLATLGLPSLASPSVLRRRCQGARRP